jgi:hypothetical protein
MGLGIDVVICATVGVFCTFIAHFCFGAPLDNSAAKGIFLLGFTGWAVFAYLLNKIESGASALLIFCIFILVLGLGCFFILPSVSEIPDNIEGSPASTGIKSADTSDPKISTTTAIPVEYYTRTYHWTYGRYNPTYTIRIPKPLYNYYRQQPHDRNYAKYAISDDDRKVLDRIITSFQEHSSSKTDAAYDVVAFVQSLPYFSDDISTGYDEYPRYPIETLVDNGGDCEDTAILTAALLKEMNYDVVMISPPGHMAIGITCSDCSGTFYTYNHKKYFYLETTGNNWKVGQIPLKYENSKVKVYPL